MPTVTKAFSFTNSTIPYTAEGGTWTVVDGVATVGSIVAGADAPTDPSASVFGLQESCTGKNKTNAGNYWQWAGTWEDLGVPSGAGWVVSDIVVTQAWRCSTFTTGAASGNNIGPTELRDSGGTLLAQGTQTAFTAATTFADRSSPTLTVPASAGASTTSIQIRLANDLATGNSTSAVVTLQQDYVRVDITYGLPATVTPATLVAVTAIPTPNIPASATATPAVLAAVTAMGAVTPTGGGGGGGGNIVGRTATLAESSSAQSITGTLPTDIVTGDVVVAHFSMSSTVATFTPPSGWTQLAAPTGDGTAWMTAAYYRFNPPSGPTATTTSLAGRQTCICQAYGSVDTTTPVDVAAAITVGVTPYALNGVIVATAGARLVSGIEINASTGTWTQPTGMTLLKTHTSGVGRGAGLADENRASTGATGTRQWTWSGTAQASVGYVVALRPAPGGGGGATATPAVLAAVTAIPAVTTGVSSTVTPATIACTATMPAATATQGAVVTPAKITCLVGFGPVKRLFAFSGLTGMITGLQASSSYQVTVRAVDTSGNRSADSAPVTVTTTAPGAGPTPATLAAVTAMPAATATGSGNATATPATIAATTLVGAPVLHAGWTVSPATLAAATAIPTPAVTAGGSATVAPATLAATTAVGAPVLHAGWTVTAATLAATTTIPAVTAGGGATTSPATIAAVTAVGSPTIAIGGVRQPATLAAVTAVPAVSAGGSAAASPVTIAAVTAVGAPIVIVGGARQPATITAVTAIPAVSAGGSAQAAPATIVAMTTIGASVLHAGSTVSVATITCTTTIPAATVSGGASSTRSPATIVTVTAIGAPAVTVSGSRTPATIVAVTSIGAPSLIFGAAVLATTIAARATMPAPVIQVKIVYRPYTGTTARPYAGTTSRP